MAYSIQTLKNDLQGVLHGTQLNQITNLNGVINRAGRQLLLDVDPQETKRTLEFINPIFNTVFDYPIAPDVKGNKIIDIRPQVQRIPRDIWTQGYNQAFDVAKQNIYSLANMFTMNFDTGLKTLRVNSPFLNPPIILNYADSIDNNGTWVLGGNATDLAVDNVNFVAGSGSLQFTVVAAGTSITLTNNSMQAINLSAQANQASMFFWIYIPDATQIKTSGMGRGLVFQWGNDNTNLWEAFSIVTNQQGTSFVNGWNLIEVPWTSAIVLGNPDASNITYLSLTIHLTGTGTAQVMRVNLFDCILGSILEYEYYSKYLFRDVLTGAFQETVTDDSNLVNLDTESFNLLFNLVAYMAIQQQQGLDAVFYDGSFFKQAYDEGVIRYKSMYKSELQKPQSVYYAVPPSGYNRIIGKGYGNW